MRYLVLILLLLAIPAAAIDDAAALAEFKAWYQTYTGPPLPGPVRDAYLKALTGQGMSEAGAAARIAALQRIVAADPAGFMRLHFDKIYSTHPELYTPEPSPLLAAATKLHKPGRALDAAMGQGRNSVYLATQGWDVTGYDISEEGMAAARRSAEAKGVRIRTIQSRHEDFDYGTEQWDMIVLAYALLNYSDTALIQKLHTALKPGGLIVLEQPLTGGTGKGPVNALLGSFARFRILHYEDKVAVAEWSRREVRLGRLIAEKE